jgi:hypothetical protein
VQGEAALVVGVDQFLVRRRRLDQDAQPGERVDVVVGLQHAVRDGRPADAVETVAARDHVGRELLRRAARVPEGHPGVVAGDVVHFDVGDLEVDLGACRQPGRDQVLDDLLLTVDDDLPAAGQLGQRDPMVLAVEAEADAVMREALLVEPVGQPDLAEQLHRRVLTHARAHTALDVVTAPGLQDYRVDAVQPEQMGQQQAGWACSHDGHLSAHVQRVTDNRHVSDSGFHSTEGTLGT